MFGFQNVQCKTGEGGGCGGGAEGSSNSSGYQMIGGGNRRPSSGQSAAPASVSNKCDGSPLHNEVVSLDTPPSMNPQDPGLVWHSWVGLHYSRTGKLNSVFPFLRLFCAVRCSLGLAWRLVALLLLLRLRRRRHLREGHREGLF